MQTKLRGEAYNLVAVTKERYPHLLPLEVLA